MRILFVGDIVGDPGRAFFEKQIPGIKATYQPDIIIVNGENSASDGRGIMPAQADWYFSLGVRLITTGNHVWAKKEIKDYIRSSKTLLRPANLPGESPGSGAGLISVKGKKIGVINLLGRVFMRELVDCPFKTALSALTYLKTQTNCIVVDIHAETTAEKAALAYYLDGKVTAVVGTHTHVQTADERILKEGTAFISDVGMCGAVDSMIGMKKGPVIEQMITQMPTRFVVETEGEMLMSAVLIECDEVGRATAIERIKIVG